MDFTSDFTCLPSRNRFLSVQLLSFTRKIRHPNHFTFFRQLNFVAKNVHELS